MEEKLPPMDLVTLDKAGQSELSKFIKQCVLEKKNLKTYKESFEICNGKSDLSPQWWQTPVAILGIAGVAFFIGTRVR